ncbi:MAG: NADH-quinone oxidoreductase subunit J, partial [Comamonadaceae bacterium]|nr:NADH-quinone oxidoreductase subunit J [Comamonadaceae bacterium]
MESTTVLFYVFSAVLLAAALRVVTARSTVHAVLFLVLAFFSAACVWLLLRAEFLAIVLVLVYVGAVMVLFLFVVMMLDIEVEALRSGFTRYAWLGWLTALVVILELAGVVAARRFGADTAASPVPMPADYSNTHELGTVLYTDYVYA